MGKKSKSKSKSSKKKKGSNDFWKGLMITGCMLALFALTAVAVANTI